MYKKILILIFFLIFNLSYAEEQKIVYINGATTVPSLITIKPPKINKNIIVGKSQYFFLTSKNLINSIIKFI